MTKKELLNDSAFRQTCSKYGMNCKECSIYGDLILLKNKEKNIYLLLDNNYNIIAIECAVVSNEEKFVNSLYNEYSNYGSSIGFEYNIGYPFNNFYLKNIVDIASRIRVIKDDNKLNLKVNGINCLSKNKDDYTSLLYYIKFLGKEIKNYQLYVFINKEIGVSVEDVNLHIHNLVAKINTFIDFSVKNRKVPKTIELINLLQNDDLEYEEYVFLLEEVIKLLLRQKGYKIENDKLEKIPVSNISNLSEKAVQLLEILSLSDSDFKIISKTYNSEQKDLFEIISLGDKHFPVILTTKKRILNFRKKI